MKYYIDPPTCCQLCNRAFKRDEEDNGRAVMFDARHPRFGSWASLCKGCFEDVGCQLGTGKGQKYVWTKKGWLQQ